MPKKPIDTPSEKQLEVLRFIEHVEEHGFQPSQQEIANAFGLTKTAISARLRELAARNLIEMPESGKERAVRLKFLKFKAYSAD